jgi:sulfur relay (sulfurtransferase) complex TusBCD TusD component (DsrE family)
MGRYLLIETRNPLDGGDFSYDLGRQLTEQRHDVTLYLLQDAVFTARKSFREGERLRRDAEKHGVHVLADRVSLRQRGVIGDRVAREVRVSDMDELVDLLMERTDKAIWH